MDKSLKNPIEWQTKEFQYFPKSKMWFLVLFVVAGVIEVYFLLSGNFFAFVTFLLVFFVVILYSVKKPNVLRLRIDDSGVKVNENKYEFSEFQSFWIFYDSYRFDGPIEVKELLMQREGAFKQPLTIPLENQDPVVLRNFLNEYLDEVEEKQSSIDILARRIGF